MPFNRWIISLLCCCLVATSCTTLRDVPLTVQQTPVSSAGIKLGDTVVVTLRDGTSQKFTVTQLDATSLSGKARRGTGDVRYPFADMASLEVRRVSFWKTSGTVAATLAVIAVALAAAMFSELDDGD
jgi:hypothetical protein